MKNIGTILAAVFLGLVLLLYMCTFQVRFTEVAIKKTWGRPDTTATTASTIRSGSASRPTPCWPDASAPTSGSTIT